MKRWPHAFTFLAREIRNVSDSLVARRQGSVHGVDDFRLTHRVVNEGKNR